jgi:hypothetical protein
MLSDTADIESGAGGAIESGAGGASLEVVDVDNYQASDDPSAERIRKREKKSKKEKKSKRGLKAENAKLKAQIAALKSDSIVLEEEIDPNYVPTEDEVIEYAKWIGMDLEKDKDLYWIAREGLKAPLPADWKVRDV